jgi:hypothetical protein
VALYISTFPVRRCNFALKQTHSDSRMSHTKLEVSRSILKNSRIIDDAFRFLSQSHYDHNRSLSKLFVFQIQFTSNFLIIHHAILTGTHVQTGCTPVFVSEFQTSHHFTLNYDCSYILHGRNSVFILL